VPSVEDAELVAMVEAIRASLADIEDHLATMERSPMAKPLTLLSDHTDSACPESFAATLRERRPVKRAVVVGELKDTHGHVNWQKVDTVLASHTEHREDLRAAYFDALRAKVQSQRRRLREADAKKKEKMEAETARLLTRYYQTSHGATATTSASGAAATPAHRNHNRKHAATTSSADAEHQQQHQRADTQERQKRAPPPCSEFYNEIEREYLRARRAGNEKKRPYVTAPIQPRSHPRRGGSGEKKRKQGVTHLPPLSDVGARSSTSAAAGKSEGRSSHNDTAQAMFAIASRYSTASKSKSVAAASRGGSLEERRAAERLGSTLALRRILHHATEQIEMTQRLMEELDIFPGDDDMRGGFPTHPPPNLHDARGFEAYPLPDIGGVARAGGADKDRGVFGGDGLLASSRGASRDEPPTSRQPGGGDKVVETAARVSDDAAVRWLPSSSQRHSPRGLGASDATPPATAALSMADLEVELPSVVVVGSQKLWRPPFLGTFADKPAGCT